MKRGIGKGALLALWVAVVCAAMQAGTGAPVPKRVQAAKAEQAPGAAAGVQAVEAEQTVEAEQAVIMLDPGHGGTNCGSIYLVESESEVLEKELTLALAFLVQEELEKQPGIKVYLTRTDDMELELKERAQAAEDAGAKLLVSLHFNDSVEHRYYGTETWVSGERSRYAEGFRLALCLEKELKALGLHSRGIKTRLLKNGKADYYGIIREGVQRDINTVLVEHCFVDQQRDEAFWKDRLAQLAKADADAILAYLEGECSDVTEYPAYFFYGNAAWEMRGTDETPPENLRIEQELLEEEWNFLLQAKDLQSRISYYDYSLDGGRSWSELESE